MTRKLSLLTAVAGAALAFAAPASGQSKPDAFERAVAAKQGQLGVVANYPDAFERAVAATQRELGVTAYPDAFERAAANLGGTGSFSGGDSHDRSAMPPTSVSASITGSGSGIEWPQIGLGFGLGVLLVLGLTLGLRLTGIRPIAH